MQKIAILRGGGLGDFIFTLPALAALRLRYPDAEIVLLGQAWHAAFLAGRPGPIDRVVVLPPARGVSLLDTVPAPPGAQTAQDAFFAAMQDEQFDLAIQLHGGGRYSNPFIRRLGARWTVGLKTPDAEPLDAWVPYVYFQPEVLRYLEVVALVGASSPAVLEPRLVVTAADLAEARRAVPHLPLDGAPDAAPLVVLHPGAGDGRRRWPPKHFAIVADALRAAGASVAIVGVDAERPLAASVASAMCIQAENLCGRLSLGGLAGLLARSGVMIGNDSGPLHLAGAVGAPTVGIYWCGNLINAGPMTRARHRPLPAWRLACPACGADVIRARCDHEVSYTADVSPEEVLAAGCELLALPPRDSPRPTRGGRAGPAPSPRLRVGRVAAD
ncbi:MAG TPA: glycosyltransferase family 9 protein [Chloroflexota bacterium]|nr:glycosyltransferase family 9 protein [Chloroflexota bacterium]